MPEYFILQEGEGFHGEKVPSFNSLEKAVDGFFSGIKPTRGFSSKDSTKPRYLAKKLEVEVSLENFDVIHLHFSKTLSPNFGPIFVVEQYKELVKGFDENYYEDRYDINSFNTLQEALDSLKSASEGKITLAKCLDFQGVVSER